jgi:hypothetical protein
MEKLYPTLEKGEIVILDSGYRNSSIVEVVSQTPNCMFTKVENEEGTQWEVMTARLTRQEEKK